MNGRTLLPLAGALFLAAMTATPRAAHAADASRAEARTRYERGKQLYEEHDYPGALAEFLRAQQLIPAPVTLLNIGQVYAAMGRPVDAVNALDKLLASPGNLKPEQIELATRTRDEQRHRIARLTVITSAPATIEVDGLPVAQTPLAEPLRVAGGTHMVSALAAGYLPARKEITVAGEAASELRIELQPSESKAAHLNIRTALPEAEVVVDGQVVGRTPMPYSLTLMPGKRVVELRRAGYLPAQKEITLGDGAGGTLAFDLEEDRNATADWGRLALQISEREAQVTVDGRSRGVYRESLRLPAGMHAVRIERGGFEPIDRSVEVRPNAETAVRVTLAPTPETRVSYIERTHRQRTWGIVALATGVVVAGAATGFTVITLGKIDDAKSERDKIDAMYLPGQRCDPKDLGPHDQCDFERSNAYQKVDDQTTKRNIGLAGIGVGAAALVTGAILLLTNDDPHKFDHSESDLAWAPLGWVGPDGLRVGLAARF